MFSYVPQTPTIIDDSILANVAFGETPENVEKKRVLEALKKAQLELLIERLPQGIDSLTGEDAVFISGGQRQRLVISRSFYFKRDFILLDEVTSALDPKTEKEVLTSIQSLRESASVIIISHSEEAKKLCDRVYYLQDGKLTEQ